VTAFYISAMRTILLNKNAIIALATLYCLIDRFNLVSLIGGTYVYIVRLCLLRF
jgi:hypothetical protein